MRAESGSLRADGHDLAFVHVEITDAEGIVRPLDDRPVSLEIDGAAALLGFGSAEPITEEGFCSPVHRTYQGRALAVLRAGHVPGQVRLTASARGCAPVDLTSPSTQRAAEKTSAFEVGIAVAGVSEFGGAGPVG